MSSDGGNGDSRDPRDQQGSGGEDEDKVIRLPRDWLGPRDELVPFGPSAERGDHEFSEERSERDDEAPHENATARPPLEEVSPPPDPVSPQDFWGERSAALQGPLDEADQDAAGDNDSVAARRWLRAPVLAAAAAVVAAVVILSISLLGQSSSPGMSRGSARADTDGGRGTLWPSPGHIAPALHRGGGSGHGRPRRNGPRLAHSSASVAVNFVRHPPSQSAAGGGGAGGAAGAGSGSSSAAPSGATPTPHSVPTPPPSSGSGSPTTTSESSTRQSKTPAFGANGALGPGHSPTG